jgi:hypothetical protein
VARLISHFLDLGPGPFITSFHIEVGESGDRVVDVTVTFSRQMKWRACCFNRSQYNAPPSRIFSGRMFFPGVDGIIVIGVIRIILMKTAINENKVFFNKRIDCGFFRLIVPSSSWNAIILPEKAVRYVRFM